MAPSQVELQAAKKALDEAKAVLRERNKELQKFEQEKKKHEKAKVDWALEIKELEHSISKFHKESRDAAQKVSGRDTHDSLHLRTSTLTISTQRCPDYVLGEWNFN